MALIQDAIELIEACASSQDASAVAQIFADRLRPHGLRGLATRVYRRPEGELNSQNVWKAGGQVAVLWPKGWDADAPGFRYICLEENPLLEAVKTRRSFFRWSDFAPRQKHGTYWEAYSEARIGDGIGMLHFGGRRRVASLSLGFERLEFSPAEQAALRAAGGALIERTVQLGALSDGIVPELTARERDCMAFVAAGKSDWDISVILGLSQSTVRFHVDNARRKLDATNRAHAIARMAALDLL